jgi:hypothetical protein
LLLLFFPACQLAAQATSNAQQFSPPTRTFRFTYNFTVKDIPSEAKRITVSVTTNALVLTGPINSRIVGNSETDSS